MPLERYFAIDLHRYIGERETDLRRVDGIVSARKLIAPHGERHQ